SAYSSTSPPFSSTTSLLSKFCIVFMTVLLRTSDPCRSRRPEPLRLVSPTPPTQGGRRASATPKAGDRSAATRDASFGPFQVSPPKPDCMGFIGLIYPRLKTALTILRVKRFKRLLPVG